MNSNTNFNFIDSQQAYQAKFFQFPQVLLYGEQYQTLSDGAKLGYMVLKDRLDYSLRNNWIDENNRVYFIFTNLQLQKLMHWSNKKVIRIKNELEKAGLLFQRKMGFDPKKKKNLPNRLYLADLDVTMQDIYAKRDFMSTKVPQALEPSGSDKMTLRQANPQALELSGSDKMTLRQKQPQTLEPSGSDKMTPYQDKTIYQDTDKIHKNTNMASANSENNDWDFSSASYAADEVDNQNNELLTNTRNFLDSSENGQLDFFLNKETTHMIAKFTRTPKEMQEFIGTIILAKNNVLKSARNELTKQGIDTTGYGLSFENIDYETGEVTPSELADKVNKTVYRYFNRIRANEENGKTTIKNQRGYLYKAMKNLFKTELDQQIEETLQAKHSRVGN